MQCAALKSKVSNLDSQLEKISGQKKTEEGKCRELENKLKIKENEWKLEKAALEEKAKSVSITTRKSKFDKDCDKYAKSKNSTEFLIKKAPSSLTVVSDVVSFIIAITVVIVVAVIRYV